MWVERTSISNGRSWLLEAVIDIVLPVFIGSHNGAETPDAVLHKRPRREPRNCSHERC